MATDRPRPVTLAADAIPQALALSTEPGWNQMAEDWRFMLDSGQAFGFVDGQERLIASGLTVEFSVYGWISMILVTERWRRQGLATALMQRCVDALRARGLVPALDASPEGREVYRRIDFRDSGGNTTRYVGEGRRLAAALAGFEDRNIGQAGPADVPALAGYDQASSGTDRTRLIEHLVARTPPVSLVIRRNGKVAGYAACRDGRQAVQIGPLLADDDASALALSAALCRAVPGPVCLDLFDDRVAVRQALGLAGFRPVTRFVRMALGQAEIFPPRHTIYAIGGPELS